MVPDIRWTQRFQNYEKAYKRLQEALSVKSLNELERNGLIQRFEFTIELAWKTLKDYLQEQGFMVNSPKETIRQAYESGYLADGRVLIEAIELRNRLSHDYNQEYVEAAEKKIRENIFPEFTALFQFLQLELQKIDP